MPVWTAQNMPDQSGRIAIVTGANSGLGLETARALGRKGAHVIMAARSLSKAEEARAQILRESPNANLTLMAVDLGSLESVRAFADAFRAQYDRLDLLFNNAGVMALPLSKTSDGFEMQFGVNHLGHFALTGLLIDRMVNQPNSRVVNVTSSAAFYGKIDFNNLNAEKSYSRYGAYGQSKLANVLFTFELERRLRASGAQTISVTAHPGFADTNLQRTTAASSGQGWEERMYGIARSLFFQSGEMGALPQLYAGTAPGVRGGEFYAPSGMHIRGYPWRTRVLSSHAYDAALAARLWQASEQFTGVTYTALAGAAVV